MSRAVVLSAVRTPVGRYGGVLAGERPDDLAAAVIKEAVAHRVGVSIMPHRVMREDIRQKRLAAIRLAGASLYRPLGIIHLKKKRFRPVAQAFLDLLCEKPVPETA